MHRGKRAPRARPALRLPQPPGTPAPRAWSRAPQPRRAPPSSSCPELAGKQPSGDGTGRPRGPAAGSSVSPGRRRRPPRSRPPALTAFILAVHVSGHLVRQRHAAVQPPAPAPGRGRLGLGLGLGAVAPRGGRPRPARGLGGHFPQRLPAAPRWGATPRDAIAAPLRERLAASAGCSTAILPRPSRLLPPRLGGGPGPGHSLLRGVGRRSRWPGCCHG